MKLSIVTTLYKSSPYIDEFYARISKEAQKITDDYEIIFVDDGSPDDSLQKAVALYEKDSKVKVIELSRNFGHHKAIMTGLSHAKGEFVFLIDSDLEEEPELLGKFWEELHKEKELDVVYGVQESRKGGWFEKWSGEAFYKVYNFISGTKIPRNLSTCRLMKKKYCDSLCRFNERELFLGGIFFLTGFRQKSYIIKKLSHSPTTYSLKLKLNMFLNSLTSFSNFPLKIVFYTGLLISSVSFIFIVWIIFRKLFFDISLQGWSSLIVSVWFLGGIILISLGIIGMYISKIFIETKNRPYSIIKEYYSKDNK